jgi:uncharacterized membrane protein
MSYRPEWIGAPVVLGAVLLPLIVPPFALIALFVVAVAVVAAIVALVAAIIASPFLLARHIRGRLQARDTTSAEMPRLAPAEQTS